jgi:hypothetical protein
MIFTKLSHIWSPRSYECVQNFNLIPEKNNGRKVYIKGNLKRLVPVAIFPKCRMTNSTLQVQAWLFYGDVRITPQVGTSDSWNDNHSGHQGIMCWPMFDCAHHPQIREVEGYAYGPLIYPLDSLYASWCTFCHRQCTWPTDVSSWWFRCNLVYILS